MAHEPVTVLSSEDISIPEASRFVDLFLLENEVRPTGFQHTK
jgi:hypothetical protein